MISIILIQCRSQLVFLVLSRHNFSSVKFLANYSCLAFIGRAGYEDTPTFTVSVLQEQIPLVELLTTRDPVILPHFVFGQNGGCHIRRVVVRSSFTQSLK